MYDKDWSSNFGIEQHEKIEIVLRIGRNMTIVVYSARWRLKMDWNVII